MSDRPLSMEDVETVEELLDSLRALALSIMSARRVDAASGASAARGALEEMSMLLGDLKAASRGAYLAVEEVKEAVQRQNAMTDAHHLTLQNLLYEQRHLLREIRAAHAFSTPAFSAMKLPALEDEKMGEGMAVAAGAEAGAAAAEAGAAAAGAGAAAAGAGVAAGTEAAADAGGAAEAAHASVLRQLTLERSLRGSLASALACSRSGLAALRERTAEQAAFLDELPSKAEGLASSMRPLGVALGLSADGGRLLLSPSLADEAGRAG